MSLTWLSRFQRKISHESSMFSQCLSSYENVIFNVVKRRVTLISYSRETHKAPKKCQNYLKHKQAVTFQVIPSNERFSGYISLIDNQTVNCEKTNNASSIVSLFLLLLLNRWSKIVWFFNLIPVIFCLLLYLLLVGRRTSFLGIFLLSLSVES
jgi:hypothetical protein